MSEAVLGKLSRPLIVIATIIWGSTFFILKDTLDNVSVYFMLAFRFSVATVILSVVFWKSWRNINKKYILYGIVMGVLLFLGYAVQNFGLIGTTPGKNAFLTAVYCVIVPFMYWFVDRTRPDKYNIIAAILCLAGVGLISLDGGFSLTTGDLLTLLGGLIYAAHIVAVAIYSKGRDIFALTVIQFAVVSVLSWISTFLSGGFPTDGLPVRAWGVLLYLAIAATTLALLFQNIGQKYCEPSAAAVLLALEAPFGVLFSVLFGNEKPTLYMICGFILIFISIICSETKLSFFKSKKELKK